MTTDYPLLLDSALVAGSLRPGDVFTSTRTLVFERLGLEDGESVVYLDAHDVADDETYRIGLYGSIDLERTESLPPRPPQKEDYTEGELLSGEQIRATMWRRGTIIKLQNHPYDTHAMVLFEDGLWHTLSENAFQTRVSFKALNDDALFELIHIAL